MRPKAVYSIGAVRLPLNDVHGAAYMLTAHAYYAFDVDVYLGLC